MKRFTFAILLFCAITLAGGCANGLPKPVQANGAVSPSATVADLDLVYQNATALATTYVATCHSAPTTPGCNERLTAQLKQASINALQALTAAHTAVKNYPQGGDALDKAIAALQAALSFLQSYTGQIPTHIATRTIR